MGQFDIDKYFSSRLKKHSENIDTDALWDALDLENDDRERGLLFWLKGLVPLLLIGTIFFYISNRTNDTYYTYNTKAESATTTEQSNPSENVEKTTPELSTVIPVNNTTITTKTTDLEPQKNSTERNTSQSNSFSPNQNTAKLLPTAISKSISPPTASRTAKSKQQFPLSNLPASIVSNQPITKALFPNSTPNLAPISVQKTELAGLEGIHSVLFNLETNRKMPSLNFNFSSLPIEPLVAKKKGGFSIGAYGGYYLLDRQLTNTLGSDSTALVNYRNNSEKTLEMMSSGIELKYQTNKGLYFKAGIEYQSINEQFSFAYSRNDTIAIDNVPVANYVSAIGDTSTVTDSGQGYKVVETNGISYNNHRLINFPISIGYQIEKGNWSLYSEGTCIIGLAQSFSGKQLDQALAINTSPDYFSSSTKIGLAASFGVGYQLNSRLGFNIQPRFQTILNSFTKETSGQQQKYNMYGLRLGINYQLI